MKKNGKSRQFSGFLDSGTSFNGELRFEGTLRVDGDLAGSITTPDVLIVGSTSTVRANITAGAIQVHGRVVGDVNCSARVEICPGGHLEGNVQTPRLIIEEGGTFEGQSRTIESGGDPASNVDGGDARPAEAFAQLPPPGHVEEKNTTRWRILSRQLDSLRASSSSSSSSSASAVEEVETVDVEDRG